MAARCPSCRHTFDQPFIVCSNCGLNITTGIRAVAHVDEAIEVDEDDEPSGPPSTAFRALQWTAEYLPGFFQPGVLIASILLGVVGLGIVVMGIFMMFMFLVLESMMVVSVGSLAYAQAVAFMIYGGFAFLTEALSEFDSTQWALWFTGLMLPGTILFALVYFGAITAQ